MLCNGNVSLLKGEDIGFICCLWSQTYIGEAKKVDRKRVFETALVEGKDLSGGSKRSAELSTLLNALHTAASSPRSDSLP